MSMPHSPFGPSPHTVMGIERLAEPMAEFCREMPCEEPGHDAGDDNPLGILHYPGPARWYITINHDICCDATGLGVETEATCNGVVDWIGEHADDYYVCTACRTATRLGDFVQIEGLISEFPL